MTTIDDSMSGRVCVVTGANSGIGREIARGLAGLGATVVMVARDRERGQAACEDVAASTGSSAVSLVVADLSVQANVRRLAAEIAGRHSAVDVLVNNAGLVLDKRVLTADGIETTLAVNHLAPFLLTDLLAECLAAAAPGRVVTVASEAHRGARFDFDDPSGLGGYSSWRAYAQSKLANILFTSELARRTDPAVFTATCMHPGVVRTGFGREGGLLLRLGIAVAGRFFLSPAQGADTAVWLAASPEAAGHSGGYYVKRRLRQASAEARDRDTARRLWEWSARACGLGGD